MTGRHTPGPWEAEALTADAFSNERPWVGRLAEQQYTALSCGETQAEAVANARLIAAAPELAQHGASVADWLEAALDCKAFAWDGDQAEAARECLAGLRAAIAKATAA